MEKTTRPFTWAGSVSTATRTRGKPHPVPDRNDLFIRISILMRIPPARGCCQSGNIAAVGRYWFLACPSCIIFRQHSRVFILRLYFAPLRDVMSPETPVLSLHSGGTVLIRVFPADHLASGSPSSCSPANSAFRSSRQFYSRYPFVRAGGLIDDRNRAVRCREHLAPESRQEKTTRLRIYNRQPSATGSGL